MFVAAPRREDYGIAPLEALADGCMLVTTPAPGAYPALRRSPARSTLGWWATIWCRRCAPRSTSRLPATPRAPPELLAPFSRAAVDRTVSDTVLPRLLTRLGTQ